MVTKIRTVTLSLDNFSRADSKIKNKCNAGQQFSRRQFRTQGQQTKRSADTKAIKYNYFSVDSSVIGRQNAQCLTSACCQAGDVSVGHVRGFILSLFSRTFSRRKVRPHSKRRNVSSHPHTYYQPDSNADRLCTSIKEKERNILDNFGRKIESAYSNKDDNTGRKIRSLFEKEIAFTERKIEST